MRHRPSLKPVQTEFGLHADQSPEKHQPTAHSRLRTATREAIRRLEKYGSRPYVKTNTTGKARFEGSDHAYMVGNPGEADIETTWFGQQFMFEIKTGTGRQSDVQAKIQRLFERAGGIYLVVRHAHEAPDRMLLWASQSGKII